MESQNVNIIIIVLIVIVLFLVFTRETFFDNFKLSNTTDIIDEKGIVIGNASMNNYLPNDSLIKIDLTDYKKNPSNIRNGNTITNKLLIKDNNNNNIGTAILCPPGCYLHTGLQKCIQTEKQTYNNYLGPNGDSVIIINT
jgi:hypothetical protein